MSPVFLGRAQDMTAYFDGEIERRGTVNRALANSYRRGATNSCFDKRQWTDTLTKARNRLLNCLTVQNWELLLDIERELTLDCPMWMSELYQRSAYAQQMLTAERKMAYAARKPRTGKDDAFHAERKAKVEARLAAEKAARQEADRLLQAQAAALLLQIGTATDQGKLRMATQVLQLMGAEKAQRFLPQEADIEMRRLLDPSDDPF